MGLKSTQQFRQDLNKKGSFDAVDLPTHEASVASPVYNLIFPPRHGRAPESHFTFN